MLLLTTELSRPAGFDDSSLKLRKNKRLNLLLQRGLAEIQRHSRHSVSYSLLITGSDRITKCRDHVEIDRRSVLMYLLNQAILSFQKENSCAPSGKMIQSVPVTTPSPVWLSAPVGLQVPSVHFGTVRTQE